jgi:hypothetical protein
MKNAVSLRQIFCFTTTNILPHNGNVLLQHDKRSVSPRQMFCLQQKPCCLNMKNVLFRYDRCSASPGQMFCLAMENVLSHHGKYSITPWEIFYLTITNFLQINRETFPYSVTHPWLCLRRVQGTPDVKNFDQFSDTSYGPSVH